MWSPCSSSDSASGRARSYSKCSRSLCVFFRTLKEAAAHSCDFACKDDSCADVVTGPPLQLDPSKGDACGLPAAAFDPTVSLVGPDGGPGYNEVLQLMQKRVSNITHDTARQTKSFVWKDSHGKPHQVSFDDPETLKARRGPSRDDSQTRRRVAAAVEEPAQRQLP